MQNHHHNQAADHSMGACTEYAEKVLIKRRLSLAIKPLIAFIPGKGGSKSFHKLSDILCLRYAHSFSFFKENERCGAPLCTAIKDLKILFVQIKYIMNFYIGILYQKKTI